MSRASIVEFNVSLCHNVNGLSVGLLRITAL